MAEWPKPATNPLPTMNPAFCKGGIPLLATALPTTVLTPTIVPPKPH